MKNNNLFLILKHLIFDLLKELIRKNPNEVSLLRRRKVNFSGVIAVASSVSFGTRAFLYLQKQYGKRDNSDSYNIIKYIFPRHNNNLLGCRRVGGRFFCTYETSNRPLHILEKDMNKISDDQINGEKNYTKKLIADKGLSKELIDYNSRYKGITGIIEKLATFKRDKCGKFLNITKDFLVDPIFLKFSYYLIKNNRGVSEDLDGINKN